MTPTKTRDKARSASLTAFVLCQVLLIGGGIGIAAYRVSQLNAARELPPLRDEPLAIGPLYDYPIVISDSQLQQVLYKLRPRFYGKDQKINNIDHALRFWGVEATFDDPAFISGQAMRDLLLDHRVFVENYGEDLPSLLIDTDSGGVRVRFKEGITTASHYDHTIAGLAEVGTPLDYPVVTPSRETTFRALIEQSLRDFSLNQLEYEWSALAYTLLLAPTESNPDPATAPIRWITSEGQQMDFDRLADRIMRQEVPQGVCAANHRMHALVMMLRVHNEHHRLFSDAGYQRVIEYLQGITDILIRNQHPDGYWTMNWPEGTAPHDDASLDPKAGQILATGHPLEWWSLAPAEVHPPRHVLASAGQWLTKAILDLSEDEVEDYYTFLTHAGRALSLWRGKFPVEAVREQPH